MAQTSGARTGSRNRTMIVAAIVFAAIAALLLFVIPVDVRTRTFVMNWETAVKLPWGILILFGGG